MTVHTKQRPRSLSSYLTGRWFVLETGTDAIKRWAFSKPDPERALTGLLRHKDVIKKRANLNGTFDEAVNEIIAEIEFRKWDSY